MKLELSEEQFNQIVNAVTSVMLSERQRSQFIVGDNWKQVQHNHEQKADQMEKLLQSINTNITK